MSHPYRKGWLATFKYALAGVLYVLRTQRNMRVHLAAVFLVLGVGSFLHLSGMEWVAISLSVFLVLAAEMFNTAIEAVVDLCSPQVHPLAKVAKDVAAGAVLLAAVNALVVGYLIIWPKLLRVL